MRILVVVVAVLVALSGCGRAPIDDRLIATAEDADRAPEGCGETPGARDDLAAEPQEWLTSADHIRWQDLDACPIRVDVVAHVLGDEGCGWQDVDLLTVGVPLGASTLHPADALTYYWDPEGVLTGLPSGDVTIEREDLPASAVDTGLRLDGTELWVDARDATVIFHVVGDSVDVWQLDRRGDLVCG